MIEKMRFVSITGPKSDIDRVVNGYLSQYEIHLENALTELKSVPSLTPFIEANPYRASLGKANEFCSLFDQAKVDVVRSMSAWDAMQLVDQLTSKYDKLTQNLSALDNRRTELKESLKRIEPFRSLPCEFDELFHFEYIRIRFGRIAKEYYQKFTNYIYSTLDTFFYDCGEDDYYVWGAYFCPRSQLTKIDAIYASLHFERIYLSDSYDGTPENAYAKLNEELDANRDEAKKLRKKIKKLLRENQEELVAARDSLQTFSANFDVRKLAACTKNEQEVFYILCGWMSVQDSDALQKAISDDAKVLLFIENTENAGSSTPPTKLKNPKIFRPFEMYIRMYGLPAYNEIDPTIFVSLTYAFIFGAMFGDIGQGLVLLFGGLLIYKTRRMDLAAIIASAGIFSTFFGFMYGSFFGFESEHPIWLSPKTQMITLPFVGKLNTVFVVAIAFGMALVLLSMIFHVINAVKARDTENIWFDHNAVAGLIFYGALTVTVFLYMSGHRLPATAILVVVFVVPLILIVLKEPLTNKINKKKDLIEGSIGMFLVQGFFELFEVLLSYFSNTISFVRIGAFAVSHAAMMEVVLMLAGAESGSPNWIVVVLGNIFVCGLEGLIVGIQVLRLEYYELFSRFYKGNGREFKPFIKKSSI